MEQGKFEFRDFLEWEKMTLEVGKYNYEKLLLKQINNHKYDIKH